MKKLIPSIAAILLFCLLAPGFSAAPVSPTQQLYMNDFANAIFNEHKEYMLSMSKDLDTRTGRQLIVIAVKSLDGLGEEEYAARVHDDWWNRGIINEGAVLILLATEGPALSLWPFDGSKDAFPGDSLAAINIQAGKALGGPSIAALEMYKAAALRLYQFSGIEPDGTLAEKLAYSGTSRGAANVYYMIAFGLGILIVLRGFYIGKKYTKRGRARPVSRKSFAAARPPMFDDNAEKVDVIELDEDK